MKQTTLTETQTIIIDSIGGQSEKAWWGGVLCHSQGKSLQVPAMRGAERGRNRQRYLLYQDTVGAICARDYKGVGSQYVGEDKLIICVKDS